jgi:pimeloyl-ACP methyl ester carboxylesterase
VPSGARREKDRRRACTVPDVSIPRDLRLPGLARAYQAATTRGRFAVHDATPPQGVRPLGTAILVPGITGSKEDFLAVLGPLARRGWRVVALDLRGQYETPGDSHAAAYELEELALDVLALGAAIADGRPHLVGHSFGGLVARSAALLDPQAVRSVALLCSGPGPVSGQEAEKARLLEAALQRHDLAEIWKIMDGIARASNGYDGVPPEVQEFLRRRFLGSSAAGLLAMVRTALSVADRTEDLAKIGLPLLVAYGEADYTWLPAEQSLMARRLRAAEHVIRGAAHSPAVQQPETTAAVLADFWDTCAR